MRASAVGVQVFRWSGAEAGPGLVRGTSGQRRIGGESARGCAAGIRTRSDWGTSDQRRSSRDSVQGVLSNPGPISMRRRRSSTKRWGVGAGVLSKSGLDRHEVQAINDEAVRSRCGPAVGARDRSACSTDDQRRTVRKQCGGVAGAGSFQSAVQAAATESWAVGAGCVAGAGLFQLKVRAGGEGVVGGSRWCVARVIPAVLWVCGPLVSDGPYQGRASHPTGPTRPPNTTRQPTNTPPRRADKER